MSGVVVAVCVVHAIKPGAGRVGSTAIDKRPVEGPVEFSELGAFGDIQCDVDNHGGYDQAVYAYGEDEAQRWAQELGRDVPPGWFGENLRLRGMVTTDAVIGERWRIGGTVELEVTGPRSPCATFGRHVEQRRWVARFTARGDVGAYLRVRSTGPIRAGDVVYRQHVPGHGVSVREAFGALMNGTADPYRLRSLLAGDTVSVGLREMLKQALDRAAS